MGCSSKDEVEFPQDPNVLNFVRGGPITLNGKSIAPGAIIKFHAKEGANPSQPIVGTYNNDEGYFTVITTKDGVKFAGAPAGSYKMTIESPKRAPNSVPAKYGKPETSDLTVEVKEGANTYPEFKLTP